MKNIKKWTCSFLILFLCVSLTGCTPISGYAQWRQDPDNWNDYEAYNKIVNGVDYVPTENETDAKETADLPESPQETSQEPAEQVAMSGMDVYFLDVGQGACTLFLFDDDTSILIDGGDRSASSFVTSYLQKTLALDDIDVVIATHYDSDHISGLIGCLNAFKNRVGTVFDPHVESDTKTYYSYVGAVEQSGAQRIHPSCGDSYTIDNAIIEFIGPVEYGYSDDNNNSVVTKISYGETSFLISGDAELESENDILASSYATSLDSDVYLCSHHGSAGAFSQEWITAISPSDVVIQCELYNSYGHPHREVMNYISSTAIPCYRTDLQGSIICHSDGSDLTWNVSPSTDLRNGESIIP